MNPNSVCIYQSGQNVLITGLYEIAGDPETTRTLFIDDLFPNCDGRAVGWHLIDASILSYPVVNPTSSADL